MSIVLAENFNFKIKMAETLQLINKWTAKIQRNNLYDDYDE